MKLRYYIEIEGARIPVTPLDLGNVKKVTEREKDQVFYRTKLSGNLSFEGLDYATLLQVEQSDQRCTEIKFIIEKNCAGFWETDWLGYFSCNDVKWNRSRCRATVTPAPDDEYRPFLENYSKPFNILVGTTAVTTTGRLDFNGDFEFLYLNWEEEPNGGAWVPFIHLNYWVDKGSLLGSGGHYNGKIYYRIVRTGQLVNGEAPELEGWQLVSTDEATQTAKYAKSPDLYEFKPYDWNTKANFTRYPELIQVPCDAVVDTAKYIDVTSYLINENMQNGCLNLFRNFSEDRYVKILWEFGRFDFSRNRHFLDVVSYLTELTAGTRPVTSRFFTEATNYVTERPNTLTGLQIASLSDVIGYSSSEAATKAEWSLKKLFDTLRQMFRVYWDLHEGSLRIEHESFFQLQGEHDLTVHADRLRLTDVYEYEKADMPRYQRLLFANANNDDFASGVIEYGGICVSREEGSDSDDQTVTEVTTDLEYLIVSGGSTGQRGFVLMLTENGQVLREAGDLTGQMLPNAGLAAANLVRDYYTHNRVLENGAVNGKMRIFKSVNRTKKQVPLTVPTCCEPVNPYAKFISTLGSDATLDRLSTSLVTGTTEFTLLHETTGTGALELGRQFDDSFDDSFR